MCGYKGENDPTRTSYVEWEVEEYRKSLGQITGVSFTGFEEPLQPFDAVNNPAPEVSVLGLSCILEIASRINRISFTIKNFRRRPSGR
jgi:hypothetical protein